MSLGKRLKEARERKGWTQLYAAKILNMPNQNLSNYERDFRSPEPKVLAVLAEKYEVDANWLLGLADNPESPAKQEGTPSHNVEALEETVRRLRAGEFVGVPQDDANNMADYMEFKIARIKQQQK